MKKTKYCDKYRKCSNTSNFSFTTTFHFLNPLPDGKISDWSKSKAFVDNTCSQWPKRLNLILVGKKTLSEKRYSIACFSHNLFKSL